jgi:hypothetical protein
MASDLGGGNYLSPNSKIEMFFDAKFRTSGIALEESSAMPLLPPIALK